MAYDPADDPGLPCALDLCASRAELHAHAQLARLCDLAPLATAEGFLRRARLARLDASDEHALTEACDEHAALVAEVCDLAARLGREVVVEGVTPRQARAWLAGGSS